MTHASEPSSCECPPHESLSPHRDWLTPLMDAVVRAGGVCWPELRRADREIDLRGEGREERRRGVNGRERDTHT